MSIFDSIRKGLQGFILGDLYGIIDERQRELQLRLDYKEGRHRVQIRPRPGKTDDNVYLNFSGLVIDRSISMLFGQDVEFDLPGEGDDTPEDEFINSIWEANKKEIFLHRMGLLAGTYGTGYVKIRPNEAFSIDGTPRARLVLIDPRWVEMDTHPEDFEMVVRYTIRFNTVGADGKEIARKQIHEIQDNSTWLIEDYMASSATGGQWELMSSEIWPYEFSQILHFQNLPAADDVYGMPDLTDDLICLQDKINFNISNENKINRLYAHPQQVGYGIGGDNKEVIDSGPGQIMVLHDEKSFLKNVEMQSDLSGTNQFIMMLRQAFFDIARTVDIDSVADKVGALTNFGLRVLYQDAINKIETKQRLYGDALLELNHRLLVIGEMNPDPGVIIWPDPLPVNGSDLSNELKTDIEMGILSKKSAASQKQYDWEQETDRMQAEQSQGGNIGAQILRAFDRGEL